MENSDNRVTTNFWLLAVFFAAILGGTSLGVLYLARTNALVKTKIAENKEAARPANIEAIILIDQKCQDCFDVAPILTNFAQANIKITSTRTLNRTDQEAQTLIAKYAIEKLPTIILRGEVQKDADLKAALSQAGNIDGDTFVLRQIGGPYVAAVSGEIKGKTELTLISDSACGKCYDVKIHQVILAGFGLKPKTKAVDIKSPEAKALIKQYKIFLLPTFVLTGEVQEYPALLKVWPQVGVVNNNAYVFTQGVSTMGVYQDLKTGKIIDPTVATKPNSAAPKK